MLSEDVLNLAVHARLWERAIMMATVVAVAIVILVAFWRRTQTIDLSLSKDKLGGSGSLVLATPVLVLFALIGFSYALFSADVTVGAGDKSVSGATLTPIEAVRSGAVAKFSEATTRIDDAAALLEKLNCALSRVEQLTETERSAIDELKARFMLTHWSVSWGNDSEFRRLAIARNDQARPSGNATRAWRWEGEECHVGSGVMGQ